MKILSFAQIFKLQESGSRLLTFPEILRESKLKRKLFYHISPYEFDSFKANSERAKVPVTFFSPSLDYIFTFYNNSPTPQTEEYYEYMDELFKREINEFFYVCRLDEDANIFLPYKEEDRAKLNLDEEADFSWASLEGDTEIPKLIYVEVLKAIHNEYQNFNAFITRNKPYNPKGRFQDESGSDKLSGEIMDFLVKQGVYLPQYKGDEEGYNALIQDFLCQYNT